ncbi:hypothetical protein D3C87_273940 [compost metagenome]|uniref:hypothetical protein n=1 Tax=Pedobacter sp. ok626 TaxID=1761882 RepID=UPI00088A8520|nr:hypothetical protein [Pedobacter sp. ok626]SDJ59432.1 hypothetical protein SAMN04487898_103348 [Pedobacter sp. ok626]
MKKVILICLAVVALGCKSMSYQESPIKIGMTENEFKRTNRSAELMSIDNSGTNIYRITSKSFVPKTEPYSFFYFYEGKLTRFVKSDRIDDYKFIW